MILRDFIHIIHVLNVKITQTQQNQHSMKLKNKIISCSVALAIAIGGTTACNNEYSDIPSNTETASFQPEMQNSSDSQDLKTLIEFNENLSAYNQTFGYYETRGFWSECLTTAAGSAVDAAGGVVGKYIGQYAGATLGSLTANPLNAFVGYVGGGYVGRYVGSVMTSAVWNIAVNKYASSSSMTMRAPKMDYDLNLSISQIGSKDPITNQTYTSQIDSIGYHHNMIMVSIQSYVGSAAKSEFDFDEFYQYIVPVIESELHIEIKLHNNKDLYENLKRLLSSLYKNTMSCLKSNDNLASFNSFVRQSIINCYPLSAKDDYILTSIIQPVSEKLNGMSKSKIHEYAKGLNTLISNSTMTKSEKAEIAQIYSILINSALLWTSSIEL